MAKRKAYGTSNKVALITYNLLLTDFLKLQVADFENIAVFSISDFFEKKCLEYGLAEQSDLEDRAKFYSAILPKLSTQVIAVENIEFDTIIVDEAQDFSSAYLMLVSQMLKGSIAHGNYYFFGDFIYQGIYDTSVYQQEFFSYIKAMGGTPKDCELTINVRNSYEVQKELDKIARTTTFSIHDKSEAEGQNIYFSYKDEADELKQLKKTLNILIRNDKISPGRITILGRVHLEYSVASKVVSFPIKQYSLNRDESYVSFCSIRKFKGMENDVIIVVDNNNYDNGNMDLHLLYVAISRAKCKAIVFESESAKCQREKILERK